MYSQLQSDYIMATDTTNQSVYTRIDKIGKIAVENFRGKIRLRWTLQSKTYQITIGSASKESLTIAKAKAGQIDLDIMMGQFDQSLVKYDNSKIVPINSNIEIPNKPNLLACWEHYKKLSVDKVSQNTVKNQWVLVDNQFSKINDKSLFEFTNASKLVLTMLDSLAPSTVDRIFTDVNAAFNLANELGFIDERKNPYSALKKRGLIDSNQDSSKRTREAFTPSEIKVIWDAFTDNRYSPDKNAYNHSYYLSFVQFCSLTGCRPGEAIALTWGDIKIKPDRTWINFCKSYSKGSLGPTKTGETRLFPVNDQLQEMIDQFPRIDNELGLMFPSIKNKSYIDQHNFSNRIFKPIVSRLVVDDLIEKYLPSYNLRHSFITRLIQSGVDIASVAKISGNSVEVILQSYYASNDNVKIPRLIW